MPFLSPLRYPGGKRRLANFLKLICVTNDLLDGDYCEPYAGGAGVALSLLFGEYVRRVHINDLDRSIFAFWHSVLDKTDSLCELIHNTRVNMVSWDAQKAIQAAPNVSLLELGFSTFFLNRTNRSGILSGGVIGGRAQSGKWKIDARSNKTDLIKRIQQVARYSSRIELYNLDAGDFVRSILPKLPSTALIYLDPPYFVKGQRALYRDAYSPADHAEIAELVSSIRQPWVISYDNVPQIRSLYQQYEHLEYSLNYSAQDRYAGSEIMFFSRGLEIPEVTNPTKVKAQTVKQLSFSYQSFQHRT